MRRLSGLDALIARFRDRWETDRQYRAAMSGVIGVGVLVSVCACMSLVSLVANNALTGGGILPGSGGQQTGGNGVVQAAPSFPTPTLAPWVVSPTPGWSSGGSSQTPVPPTATVPAPPTATPQAPGLTGHGNPDPWVYCSGGTTCDSVVVQATGSVLVDVTITYPATDPAQSLIHGQIQTGPAGKGTFKFAAPHGSGKAHVSLLVGTQTYVFDWQCQDG